MKNPRTVSLFSLRLLCCAPLWLIAAAHAETETVLDTVVATVNGAPITLSEISARLRPKRTVTITQAAMDPEVRYALDQRIQELLLREDAKARRLSAASQEDVEGYLGEIANRNGLDRQGLEAALNKEGLDLQTYKQRVELDILKTRLTAALARDGVGISEQDIESYIEEHPEFSENGTKVKLRQILVAFGDPADASGAARLETEALQVLERARDKLEDGEEFSKVAREFSDGTEKHDGGSLGVMLEKDLNPVIADAVILLKPGEVSEPVRSARGFHIFLLEDRFSDTNGISDSLRSEVRAMLERQRMEERITTYFTVDLFKKYHVEKKI